MIALEIHVFPFPKRKKETLHPALRSSGSGVALLVELTLLFDGGILVLLVLRHEIVHVRLSLGEFHLVRFQVIDVRCDVPNDSKSFYCTACFMPTPTSPLLSVVCANNSLVGTAGWCLK